MRFLRLAVAGSVALLGAGIPYVGKAMDLTVKEAFAAGAIAGAIDVLCLFHDDGRIDTAELREGVESLLMNIEEISSRDARRFALQGIKKEHPSCPFQAPKQSFGMR